jgi:hypothetical protein
MVIPPSYDVAVISETEMAKAAIQDNSLWDAVREHNLLAFRQAWKKFEEAVKGTMRLVPQPRLRAEIEKDYRAMEDMVFGSVPPFDWIVDRLQAVQDEINQV